MKNASGNIYIKFDVDGNVIIEGDRYLLNKNDLVIKLCDLLKILISEADDNQREILVRTIKDRLGLPIKVFEVRRDSESHGP